MGLRELEEKRAQLRAAKIDAPRAEQLEKDTAAILELEIAQDAPLHTMTVPGYKPGAPVRIAFRSPSRAEYKRYLDLVGRAGQKGDAAKRQEAQLQLADVCLVYPTEKDPLREALLEAYPGALISLAIEAAAVAELTSEAEGKG